MRSGFASTEHEKELSAKLQQLLPKTGLCSQFLKQLEEPMVLAQGPFKEKWVRAQLDIGLGIGEVEVRLPDSKESGQHRLQRVHFIVPAICRQLHPEAVESLRWALAGRSVGKLLHAVVAFPAARRVCRPCNPKPHSPLRTETL